MTGIKKHPKSDDTRRGAKNCRSVRAAAAADSERATDSLVEIVRWISAAHATLLRIVDADIIKWAGGVAKHQTCGHVS